MISFRVYAIARSILVEAVVWIGATAQWVAQVLTGVAARRGAGVAGVQGARYPTVVDVADILGQDLLQTTLIEYEHATVVRVR
jgi:hypothetical protein